MLRAAEPQRPTGGRRMTHTEVEMPNSTERRDLPTWGRGNSRREVTAFLLIALVSVLPFYAGYLVAPPRLHFTGMLTYTEDIAQHQTWAAEMAAHGRYQNILTPEDTKRGWFFSPIEFAFGVFQQASGIPYILLRTGLGLLSVPLLALALMGLGRHARLKHSGAVA